LGSDIASDVMIHTYTSTPKFNPLQSKYSVQLCLRTKDWLNGILYQSEQKGLASTVQKAISSSTGVLPGSSVVGFRFPFKYKTIFITLAISQNYIIKALHNILRTLVHKAQSSIIIWFSEIMFV